MLAMARPKFPPPMTAIRIGYVVDSDVDDGEAIIVSGGNREVVEEEVRDDDDDVDDETWEIGRPFPSCGRGFCSSSWP
jgi:hypothetical protein